MMRNTAGPLTSSVFRRHRTLFSMCLPCTRVVSSSWRGGGGSSSNPLMLSQNDRELRRGL